MNRTKEYPRAKFSPETIQLAVERLEGTPKLKAVNGIRQSLTVDVDDATWTHDTEEEFFADYRRSEFARFSSKEYGERRLEVGLNHHRTDVSIRAESRQVILSVFEVFESHLAASLRPAPPSEIVKPRVFIGHGRSMQWRDLKEHLQDKHNYDIEAYEVGARAGHAVRDILEDMMESSAFALIVMTGEDETAEGLRPRQNVVHEAGLFQGRLGFSRAIVLLEEGTEAFSNIEGIDQIRFSKGKIREAFGDVLATLKREFP